MKQPSDEEFTELLEAALAAVDQGQASPLTLSVLVEAVRELRARLLSHTIRYAKLQARAERLGTVARVLCEHLGAHGGYKTLNELVSVVREAIRALQAPY